MIYLLAKILILLLLAAFLGAWLAHWWLRRQFEDVTREFASMDGAWLTWRNALSEKMRYPLVDLSPMQAWLARLETSIHEIDIPESVTTDLGPVMSAIAAIKNAPPRHVDLQPVLEPLAAIDRAVRDMHTRPSMDLTDMHRRLEQLQQSVQSIVTSPINQVDLRLLFDKLASMDERAAAAEPHSVR